MGIAEVRARRDRDTVAASPAWRQGSGRVPNRRLPGGLCECGDRRAVPIRSDEHRHAGDAGQGLGGAPRRGSQRIVDDILDQLREFAATGTPCVLATVVRCEAPTSARPGDKAIITADGRLRGWIGGSCSEPVVRREALRALHEGTPRLVRIVGDSEVKQSRKSGELTIGTTCPSGGSLDIFIEPQMPKPLLLVFGDSPAAATLVRLAELTGFRARVVGQAEVPTFETPPGEGYAVIATMGHFDEEALEAALSHPDLEVSLIASTRRASAVRAELLRRGLGEDAVARIR
ncbi:MAG: hypothetical protein E6I42_11260, partial [Chloroflexi bacterium]